ncbi:copper amine oxidase [Chitinophaga sp. GCM10012297]|uniref:Copper amine oxidase n=1 Tax=Chitinophaga chungangae TaxID=2821488 RepID=A0ABS3Y8L6_9BACT|nr:hypothetical protein [Chitinophaga chungangae]MBO9151010.1 hypothetical protein [Chitinophaga chungangae]
MKQPDWKTLLLACILASPGTLAQELKPELTSAILRTKQGSIVELPDLLMEKIPDIAYRKVIMPGPQYLIADDPEYIRVPEGIALQEPVQPGAVRLYVYNVNGVKEPAKIDRRITAVIKNTGTGNMHIRMLKYSSQKPSANYYQVGKQGLADYFASKPQRNSRTIKPGQAIAIDEQLEKNIVRYNELVHGFYEFVIDQPGEISVIQTDLKTTGPDALKRITNIIPPKGQNAGRGVFGVSNYRVIADSLYDTKNGTMEIVLADGARDPWVEGKMQGRPDVAALAGNYGVMYNIEMKWKSSDGKGLALVTWNARSGNNQWCAGMANTMVVSKGKFREGIIQLPSDRLVTKAAPEAVLIQIFEPAANGGEQTIRLTYSPPGASCLPTPLVFIPVDLK